MSPRDATAHESKLVRSTESRGKGTVEIVSKWKHTSFFLKLQDRHLSGEVLNDVFVFFPLKAARAVDERAFRAKPCGERAAGLQFSD